MKKLTMRIFTAALAAALFSTVGMLFMGAALTNVTQSYTEFFDVYVSRKSIVQQISRNIYNVQALTSMHTLSDDDNSYALYEAQLENIIAETEVLMNELGANVGSGAEKEEVHTIGSDFYGFADCVDVVTDLSRKNRKETALYYFNTQMCDYVNNTNADLQNLIASIDAIIKQRENELSSSEFIINIIKYFCVAAAGVVEVICVLTIRRAGREIEDVQTKEQRDHQLAYIELQDNVINGMANLIESRDVDTGEHVKRTSTFVRMIANELKSEGVYSETLTDSFIENIVKAAPLHDVGKIRISDAILQKPGKLTVEEFEIMKTHSALGGRIVYDILGDIEEKEYITTAYNIATYHHEKWDGNGYPEHLSGEKIPLEARIMAVADVFDALISKRCYKSEVSVDEAYEIIAQSSGSHFDPKIADAFIRIKPAVKDYVCLL